MRFRPDRYRELRSLVRPDAHRDVEEELRHHLDQCIADGMAAGLGEQAAREAALRRFGDLDRYERETIALDEQAMREERRMQVLDAIGRETRQAVRSLVRTPLFLVVAVLTLGLGLGATTSIYTLLDSIVLRPLDYPESERLVQVGHAVPGIQADMRFGTAEAQYFYYAGDNRVFEAVGVFTGGTFALSENGEAERVEGALVTASLLEVLGVRAAYGRPLTASDDEPGAQPVVLLSHELWQSLYNGDQAILNRQIRVDGSLRTVVGITSPGRRLPHQQTRLWVPLQLDPRAEPVNSHWLSLYGRLRPGATLESAQQDLARMATRLPELLPQAYSAGFMEESGFRPVVTTVRSELLGGIERVLWILLASVLLVLLIAAANVANLFMVRTEARRREIALRSSLGAERTHLALQYLTESITLSLVAGLLGLGFAWGFTRLLVSTAPAGLPRLDEIAMSPRVLLASLLTALVAGVIFGLFPVLRARVDYGALREGGRGLTGSRRQHAARNALVAGQMAMALVLLVGGALLLQSYLNLRRVDDGIEERGVLTFEISAPYSRYSTHGAVHAFYRELTERIEALPGVQAAGGTVLLPFGGGSGCVYTVVEGAASQAAGDDACVPAAQVLPGYFESMGIDVRGESFDWGMLDRAAGVAVISRALADRFFPGVDPVGRGIMSYRDGPPWYRIIGVAEDVRHDGYDKPPLQAIYYPQMPMDGVGTWGPVGDMSMTVRTEGVDPDALAPALRQIVREMDPEVPLASFRTMSDVISRSGNVARASFTLLLLSISAGMALFLSIVGLYGVVSYVVAQRRAEIGVRMALGARSQQVRRLVLLQSLRVVLLGVAVGVPAALVASRLLRALLFGVSPADPVTVAGVALLLVLIAAAASYLPALRAAAVPPMQVLRED